MSFKNKLEILKKVKTNHLKLSSNKYNNIRGGIYMRKLNILKALAITGLMLTITLATVGAETVYKTVNATLRSDMTVKLEDQALSLKDEEGKELSPLILDGTIYLPVKAIGDSAGLNIDLDEKTHTLNLNRSIVKSTPIGVRGTVKDIVKGKDGITFSVEGKKQIDTLYDIATVTVNRDTIIENAGSYSDIKEGSIVEVTFPEFVAQSYPVMSSAAKLTVLSSDDIAVRGVVKDLAKGADGVTFSVEGKKENDTMYDNAIVTVNMKTVVENVNAYGDIKEGDTVEVKFKALVSEPGTSPVMGLASAIKVVTMQ